MLTLVIQTVINRIDIALLRDDILLSHESWVSEKDEVKKVVPAIELVFRKSGFSWNDLSQIVVVVGKGTLGWGQTTCFWTET
jgi:tRNA A37 threonylcarbamoyladenosine modification protein TsaB